MGETKYGHHILQEPFKKSSDEFGGKMVFSGDNNENSGVIFEHYCIDDPKWGIDGIRVNDTHELLCFIGGDPRDIRNLGAEIHLCLGDDLEEQIVSDTTVVNIPPGLKNGYISIRKFTKPFSLLRIVTTKEYQDKVKQGADGEDTFHLDALLNGSEVPKHGKKYWMNMMRGPLYIDYEPGWTGTSIWAHHNEYRNGISLGYHCIVTPYDVRMNHGHDFHENLCFLSGDPENPHELGAEVKVCLGNEMEENYFNKPSIISMPPGLKHCPMLVHNVKKPVIFLEVSATTLFKGKPEDV